MDHMTDTEFHIVFDRVSQTISLKGASSADEVHRRLRRAWREYKEAVEQAKEEDRPLPKGIRKDIANTRKLIASEFGNKVASETLWNPDGRVALTVKCGRKRAKEILLRRARQRQGELRFVSRYRSR